MRTKARGWMAIRSLSSGDDGASIVKYALIIGLIAVVAIIAVSAFGSSLSESYSDIGDAIP